MSDAERGNVEPSTEAQTVWSCKIGSLANINLPRGADLPMHQAIKAAFYELLGEHAEFTFSGWGTKLDESQLAVVQNREPRLESLAPRAAGAGEPVAEMHVVNYHRPREFFDAMAALAQAHAEQGMEEPVAWLIRGKNGVTLGALTDYQQALNLAGANGPLTIVPLYAGAAAPSGTGGTSDTERLDWLETNKRDLIAPMLVPEFGDKPTWWVVTADGGGDGYFQGSTLRAAIDLARAPEKP